MLSFKFQNVNKRPISTQRMVSVQAQSTESNVSFIKSFSFPELRMGGLADNCIIYVPDLVFNKNSITICRQNSIKYLQKVTKLANENTTLELTCIAFFGILYQKYHAVVGVRCFRRYFHG